MRQAVKPGVVMDFVTPDELAKIIPRPGERTRIRETEQRQLDAAGNGVIPAYVIPAGYRFEVRRVTVDIGGANDAITGAVALNVAGRAIIYQRSGVRIEYGQPQYGPAVQVPGVQTWGEEQGPALQNKEVFEVRAVGLTANAQLLVVTEGILTRPAVL